MELSPSASSGGLIFLERHDAMVSPSASSEGLLLDDLDAWASILTALEGLDYLSGLVSRLVFRGFILTMIVSL